MAVDLTVSNNIAAPYSAASPAYTPSIGTNLEGLSYYSTALSVLDLMKSASAWLPQNIYTYDTFESLNLDTNGWVTSIPAISATSHYDRIGLTVLANNAAAPADARYVVLYDGEGQIGGALGTTVVQSESVAGLVVVQAAGDGSLQLQLLSTDPNKTGDYIRDIHIVLESNLPLYNAGLTFNPAFLSKVENFSTFRFMDLMDTNKIFDKNGTAVGYDPVVGYANVDKVGTIDWADRPKLTDAQWDHGVPVEALVEAANLAGTDVWFNMPVNASDDYVRGFADYVRDHLRPDLKIHVEFSNEVWNFQFVQSEYALQQAKTAMGGNGNFFEWYGMRSAQVGAIWKEEFGETITGYDPAHRVSVVVNTQLAYKGLEHYALDTPNWFAADGTHISASDYFDEYAVADYYGDALSSDANLATVRNWLNEPDGGFTSGIAALNDQIVNYNEPLYEYHAAQAAARGLKLVAYEGGYGAVASLANNGDTAITDFFSALQRDPRIGALEKENYTAFKQAGGTLYNNFEAIASSSKYGSFGALESVLQDTSPRYQALTELNSTVAPIYGVGQTATTFQNARLYQAGDGGEVVAGTLHGYDVLAGGAGNDVFVLYGTGSKVDGETGFDTVIVPGKVSDYSFVQHTDGTTVITGNGESWTVKNIDKVTGNDGASRTIGTGPLGIVVTSVVATGAGIVAGAGNIGVDVEVILTVNLSGAVNLSGGVPTLALNDGAVATYVGGSGTAALQFRYVVAAGENVADLAVTAINLNNANVVANLPTTAIGVGPVPDVSGAVTNPDGLLTIDTVVKPLGPVVTSIATSGTGISAGTGILGVGAVVTLTVHFSDAVSVSGGVPTLGLNDGGTATYVGGSGSDTLHFTYVVAAGEKTPDLAVTTFNLNNAIVRAGSLTITSGSEGSLTDANGHVFSFGGNYNGADSYVLRDGVTHGAGKMLALVDGIVWNLTSYYGWYSDHDGTYVYEPKAPSLEHGHVADFNGVVANPGGVLQIDAISSLPVTPTGPVVTSVVASGSGITGGAGTVGTGAVVTLTVKLSEAVSVRGGVPTLTLNDGGIATYASGSGSDSLKFTYKVSAGETSADLAVTAFHLNNATVTTGTPTITGDGTGTLTDANGHVFSFGGVYNGTDHYIFRDGVPDGAGATLVLINGIVFNHTALYGWYADNNGVFVYQADAPTLDPGVVADLSSAVTNPVGVLKVDTSSPPAPVVPVGPVVASLVASGAGITAGAGTLGAGAVVTLTINLSQQVSVSGGVPTLELNDGGVATYVGGSGSNMLRFSYTVAAGETTADLTVAAVHLNGATVSTGTPTITAGSGGSLTDANGHVFSFGGVYSGADHYVLRDGITHGSGTTLALVDGRVWDQTSSYGWYSDHDGTYVYEPNAPTIGQGVAANLNGAVVNPSGILHIDASTPVMSLAPVVNSVVASGVGIVGGSGTLDKGAVVTLTVKLSDEVSVYGGAPTLELNNGGLATYIDGSGSDALNFRYTVAAGQATPDLTVTAVHLNGATVGTGTPTILGDSSASLIDANGHIFSFGGVYQGADHYIFRDGLPDGAGSALALVNGTIYDRTSSYGWYADHNGAFVYVADAPVIDQGHLADLSGAMINPAGILHIGSTTTSTSV